MKFTYKDKWPVHIIYFSGDLTSGDNDKLIEHVNNKIENGCFHYVLDLSDIKHINSIGIGLLIRILTKSRIVGGETVLINISKELSKLLLITKLDTVFKTFDNLDDGVNELNKSK